MRPGCLLLEELPLLEGLEEPDELPLGLEY